MLDEIDAALDNTNIGKVSQRLCHTGSLDSVSVLCIVGIINGLLAGLGQRSRTSAGQ